MWFRHVILQATVLAGLAAPAAPASPSEATLFASPPLEPVTLVFAYDKWAGLTPDFHSYAERSQAYLGASVFEREQVFRKQLAGLASEFSHFNLARTYLIRLSVPIQAYDSTRHGFPLGMSEDEYIPFTDPATSKAFGVRFTNKDQVDTIPAADPDAAEGFAHRFSLNSHNSLAGFGIIEVAYQLADTPPQLGDGTTMVDATILAARVRAQFGGQPIYDFGVVNEPSVTVAAGASKLPSLPAVDVQGIRLGTPLSDAKAASGAAKQLALQGLDPNASLFFDGLQRSPDKLPRCGGFQAKPDAPSRGTLEPPMFIRTERMETSPFKQCLAFSVDGAGAVKAVTAIEELPGATLASVRQALEKKYGPPTYVLGAGTGFAWIGSHDGDPHGTPVKIDVALQNVGNDTNPKITMLVTMTPYTAPSVPKVARPPAPSVPNL